MDSDALNALARGCTRWLLRHRNLFDPECGSVDESRVTAACELALLAWLLLREQKPLRLSHRSLLLRAALSCVQRWQQSTQVQAIFAGGPVEAWSGELALAVPTRAPAHAITERTSDHLARVDADRQLEWCWWCMQIDAAANWQQRIRQIAPQLLARTLADAAPLTTRDAYRLTHLIFYSTDFGRTALTEDSTIFADLRRALHGILQTHARNHDLIAEALVSLRCLGWQDSDDGRAALNHVCQAQLPHGAFTDAAPLAAYHPCLVLLLPVACAKSTLTAVDESVVHR